MSTIESIASAYVARVNAGIAERDRSPAAKLTDANEKLRRAQLIESRLKLFKPALASDYNRWLYALLAGRGEIDQVRDQPFVDKYTQCYLIDAPCTLPDKYGARSYNAIVLPGVHVDFMNGRDIGHGDLFLYDPTPHVLTFHGTKEFKADCYSDTTFDFAERRVA